MRKWQRQVCQKKAYRGFSSIIENKKRYSNEIISQAFLNLSSIQSRNRNYKESHQSFLKGIEHFSFKKNDLNLATIKSLLNQSFFSLGKEDYFFASRKILKRICLLSGSFKEEILEDLLNFSLADGTPQKIIKVLDYYEICLSQKKHIIREKLK